MNTQQRRDYVETYEMFREICPEINRYDLLTVMDNLKRLEKQLHRIADAQCSVELSELDYERLERKEVRLSKKVYNLASGLGCQATVNAGDPRGASIKLYLPNGATNSFNRDYWGIFW